VTLSGGEGDHGGADYLDEGEGGLLRSCSPSEPGESPLASGSFSARVTVSAGTVIRRQGPASTTLLGDVQVPCAWRQLEIHLAVCPHLFQLSSTRLGCR
jgi:hypothetical protein